MALCGINVPFETVSPARGHIIYALLTRLPLSIAASFDLHVLGTPPALVLSQDQTLRQIVLCSFRHTTLSAEIANSLAKVRDPTFSLHVLAGPRTNKVS